MKIEHTTCYIDLLERELQDSKSQRELAIKEKKECENQIHKLVADLEKIKIENKELNTVRNGNKTSLKKTPGDKYDVEDESEFDSERDILKTKTMGFRRNNPQVQSSAVFKCQECEHNASNEAMLEKHLHTNRRSDMKCNTCNDLFNSEADLKFHIHYEHRNLNQWNCLECPFQTNNKGILKNHVNVKHTNEQNDQMVECDKCVRKFMSTWYLRNHVRDDHEKTEECVFYKANKCRFGSTCWKLHTSNPNKEPFTCFSCKKGFQTMNGLMSHRKVDHIELCRPCVPKNGKCIFENIPQKCWFLHEDFQQERKKHNPPLNNTPSNKQVEKESRPYQ